MDNRAARPTEQFCQQMQSLLTDSADISSALPNEAQKVLKKLISIFPSVKTRIELEEKNRPELMVDSEILEEQTDLEHKIETERKAFHQEFLDKEKKCNELETELNEVHQEILENQNSVVIDKLTTLVDSHRIHMEITSAIDELSEKIDEQCCCTRYIFCCFQSKDIKAAQTKIAELRSDQASLKSKDSTAIHMAIMGSLTRKREKLQAQRSLILAQTPTKVDEVLVDRSLEIDAMIANQEAQFYSAVSIQTMFSILQAYYYFSQIIKKLESERLAPKEGEKTQLISAKQSCIDLFMRYKNVLEKLFFTFWCPDSYNRRAITIYSDLLKSQPQEIESIFNHNNHTKILPQQTLAVENTSSNPLLHITCVA